jgi:membrane protein DedA with SNARE-associated domain
MIGFDEASLMAFFAQYAYQPMAVYGFIIGFMFASSFGLPVPEELTLISAGLVAYMAKNPDIFPPPYPGAESVNTLTLAIVCFVAVFMSDLTVYLIGKFFGAKIIKTRFFQKRVAGEGFDKINSWFQKYGGWACGIFRFTPGLRFPGHMSCGLLGISIWKFMAVDGLAALISVPTQVYFVSTYGEVILTYTRRFKMYVLAGLAVFAVVWLIKKIYQKNVRRHQELQLKD